MFEISKLSRKKFPAPLLEIPEPPKQLYLQGKLPDMKKFVYLAVVGSRRYSSYGREVCEKIISELAGWPIVVVSGLALGIDALAHQTALTVGLPTIAVPGSGLDRSVLYPAANKKLAEKILTAGGALLSEFEPTTVANIYTFPRRNRIMAGLTRATLIIEASQKSGTLITARLATEYNREVLAVPGSIFSPNSYGPNWLIGQGATVVTSGADVLSALGFSPVGENPKADIDYSNLSEPEQKIIALLKTEPLARDLILDKIKHPAGETNSLLSLLEIKGLIKESLGEFHLA